MTMSISIVNPQNPSDEFSPNSPESGAYTFVLADAGQEVDYTGPGPVTFSVPASVFTAGAVLACRQLGAGQVTIAGAGGTLVHCANAPATRTQYSRITITQDQTIAGLWYVDGDTAAVVALPSTDMENFAFRSPEPSGFPPIGPPPLIALIMGNQPPYTLYSA